jgi:hypothetical protein
MRAFGRPLKPLAAVTGGTELLFVAQVVVSGFFAQVKLDRVEPHNDQIGLALLTGHAIALLDFGINVNFLFAFRTDGCRHFLISPENLVNITKPAFAQ